MPLRHTPELSQDLPGNNIPEQVADARWRGQWAGLMPLAPAVPAPENKLLKGSPPETPSVVGLAGGDRHLRVDLSRMIVVPRTTGIVKGFRTPASHRPGGFTEAGVRKASREETAGGVRTDAGVDLWGIC
ncbi:MAG TPA: hypothetical protein VGK96_16275, partial [Candidatus Sulfotelmatobacter sp.]